MGSLWVAGKEVNGCHCAVAGRTQERTTISYSVTVIKLGVVQFVRAENSTSTVYSINS